MKLVGWTLGGLLAATLWPTSGLHAQNAANLQLRLQADAVPPTGSPTFSLLLVNDTDHDVHIPVPAVNCEDSYSGWIQIHLNFRSLSGKREPEVGEGCVEKEAALGKQLATEFRQRTTAITSPRVQEYVENLGHQLAPEMPETPFRFTFSIIAEDPCPLIHEPNALPGGYVFVPAALFVEAKDEAEFAGMLAHAMAHIVERHGVQQPILQDRSPSPSAPVPFLGGCCDSVAPFQVVPMGFLKLQRTLEREADLLAVETMAHAGFDPNALVRYTERVQPGLPLKKDRIAIMLSVIAKLPRTNYPAPTSGEFQAAREAVVRLLPQDRSTPPSLTRNPRQ